MKRKELEEYLCEVQKKQKEAEKLRDAKKLTLKHARENADTAREEWTLHRKNMDFMMSADCRAIMMDDYPFVKQLLTESSEKYEEEVVKARNLAVAVANYDDVIAECDAEITRIKRTLAECGNVIQGPWKATA